MPSSSNYWLKISDKKLDSHCRNSKKIESLAKLIFLQNYFEGKKSTPCLNSSSLSDSIRYWSHVRWTLNAERIKRTLIDNSSSIQNGCTQHISYEPSSSTNLLKLFHDITCYPVENLMHPSREGRNGKIGNQKSKVEY